MYEFELSQKEIGLFFLAPKIGAVRKWRNVVLCVGGGDPDTHGGSGSYFLQCRPCMGRAGGVKLEIIEDE